MASSTASWDNIKKDGVEDTKLKKVKLNMGAFQQKQKRRKKKIHQMRKNPRRIKMKKI